MPALTFLLSLVFPRRCVFCGKLGRYLCLICRKKIKFVEFQICPVCERAAINGATHPGCQKPYSLDGLTSFFIYDGPIKKAIKELKYRFVTDLASELTSLCNFSKQNVGQEILCLIESARGGVPPSEERREQSDSPLGFVPHASAAPDLSARQTFLTPVPLHPSRLRWRGFNQAELLGKILAEKIGVKFIPDLLIRKKPTKPQVELKGDDRQKNIQNAFVLNPRFSMIYHLPSNIIVFDDVWTTGATLRTCGAVLKRAGIKSVWGLTIAR